MAKAHITGAQALVDTLINEGVTTVFGYPGGTVLDIFDALYKTQDKIQVIEPTHEQHGTHAADGYARATGKTGVMIATSGPGATNLVTGIATAYLDSIPMVAITGNVSRGMIGTDAFQELDITGVTLPITKHNYFVRDAARLPQIVHEAFELANSGRRGPVLVDIPADVQRDFIAARQGATATPEQDPALAPRHISKPNSLTPAADDLQKAARFINQAERPFVYFGGGAVWSNAGKAIVALAHKIGAPLGSSLMGLSAIPTDTRGFLGMEGMHGHFASTQAINECDCLIALGVRFNDRSTGNRHTFAPSGKVVHVDVDTSEFSKTLQDFVEVQSDIGAFVEAIEPLLLPNTHETWQRRVRELRAEERGYDDYREGVTPKNVMEVINQVRPPAVPVVTDVGQHQMWAAQYLRFSEPRTFITSGGLGTMGFGVGAALGASVARDKAPTILITGDGSFAMDMSELITLADHQIPVVIVLLNNGVLGMVRQMQTLFRERRYASTNLNHRGVSYCAVAKALGVSALQVNTLDELQEALSNALAQGAPSLIEVPIDKDEFVTPVLQIGASMQDLIVNVDDIKKRLGK